MRRMRLENEKDEDYKDICIDVRYFPKGTFPSGNFPKMCNLPSGNFPNVQFSERQLPKSGLVAVLGPGLI